MLKSNIMVQKVKVIRYQKKVRNGFYAIVANDNIFKIVSKVFLSRRKERSKING